jgi:hypothetical protein
MTPRASSPGPDEAVRNTRGRTRHPNMPAACGERAMTCRNYGLIRLMHMCGNTCVSDTCLLYAQRMSSALSEPSDNKKAAEVNTWAA